MTEVYTSYLVSISASRMALRVICPRVIKALRKWRDVEIAGARSPGAGGGPFRHRVRGEDRHGEAPGWGGGISGPAHSSEGPTRQFPITCSLLSQSCTTQTWLMGVRCHDEVLIRSLRSTVIFMNTISLSLVSRRRCFHTKQWQLSPVQVRTRNPFGPGVDHAPPSPPPLPHLPYNLPIILHDNRMKHSSKCIRRA